MCLLMQVRPSVLRDAGAESNTAVGRNTRDESATDEQPLVIVYQQHAACSMHMHVPCVAVEFGSTKVTNPTICLELH